MVVMHLQRAIACLRSTFFTTTVIQIEKNAYQSSYEWKSKKYVASKTFYITDLDVILANWRVVGAGSSGSSGGGIGGDGQGFCTN